MLLLTLEITTLKDRVAKTRPQGGHWNPGVLALAPCCSLVPA